MVAEGVPYAQTDVSNHTVEALLVRIVCEPVFDKDPNNIADRPRHEQVQGIGHNKEEQEAVKSQPLIASRFPCCDKKLAKRAVCRLICHNMGQPKGLL